MFFRSKIVSAPASLSARCADRESHRVRQVRNKVVFLNLSHRVLSIFSNQCCRRVIICQIDRSRSGVTYAQDR